MNPLAVAEFEGDLLVGGHRVVLHEQFAVDGADAQPLGPGYLAGEFALLKTPDAATTSRPEEILNCSQW